ncbi:hypothetical protein [Dactylosporangium sp. CA-092794]|uniref:hypothetical protein n=1 Tax=Dactylosporangium sp. CA-092794 TaxID=3239929 RepID=UPI003D8F7489
MSRLVRSLLIIAAGGVVGLFVVPNALSAGAATAPNQIWPSATEGDIWHHETPNPHPTLTHTTQPPTKPPTTPPTHPPTKPPTTTAKPKPSETELPITGGATDGVIGGLLLTGLATVAAGTVLVRVARRRSS